MLFLQNYGDVHNNQNQIKRFQANKRKKPRVPRKTITDADYVEDIAETLLHSLERAATGIGLHVNSHKTEYMCFNITGDISTLNGCALKLVDNFTYLAESHQPRKTSTRD